MDQDKPQVVAASSAERLAREFFSAIDARDPHRLRGTLADHATFRSLPHRDAIRPADDIVAYFGSVVSSYPTARWDVTDVIASDDRAAVQFIVREYAPHLGRELVSEQLAIMRVNDGKIVSIVGYYDASEFKRLFWDDAMG
jgi:ketosteroid isomerase-like protein